MARPQRVDAASLVTVTERKLQRVHDRAVRDPLLCRVGGRREDDGTGGTRILGDRLRQPALADPGLSREHHDTTVAGNGAADRACLAKGRCPPDERHALRVEGRLRRRTGCRSSWMCNQRRLSVTDGFVPSGRLGERVDAELALQDRHARAVLAHRACSIFRSSEELHPTDMRRLVERVEVDPPAGGRNRPREVTVPFEYGDEAVQHPADGPLRRGSPRRAPVVELRAVAEGEPSHERAARQLGGGCEVRRVT